MYKSRLGVCLWAVMSFFSAVAHAQSAAATPEDEYKKLIRVSEDVQPLGEHPFGEDISLYDGSLSFQQVDVSASGDGPVLQLVRRFQIEGLEQTQARTEYAFGDWDLVIPHMETLTATGFTATQTGWVAIDGWEVNALDPQARCNGFAQPPAISMQPGDAALTPWQPGQWWKGYHLIVPGVGNQDVLANTDAASKGTYPAVTKDHWRISCLANTANGMPGEGFLAQSPDGTKYWFDELVYRYARSMKRSLYDDGISGLGHGQSEDLVTTLISLLSGSTAAQAASASNVLSRKLAWMMVTKIQDRFGNTLVFAYDATGHLTGITASDGRALSIAYASGTPRIQSVTWQPSSGAARTWTYAYNSDGTSLISVTQPDSSQWLFNLSAFNSASLSTGSSHSSCITLGIPSDLQPVSGTITHPSGLVGTFTVSPKKHGRSYVPRQCVGLDNNGYEDTQGSSATTPDAWYSFAVTQESLSGAGISTKTWAYSYSLANESWSDCSGSCPTTVYTDVVNPDGSTERSTFSNRFDVTESQLKRTDFYVGAAGSSTLLRSEASEYAPPDTSSLPAQAGYDYTPYVNAAQVEKYSPLDKRVITQDGDTYTWEAEAFNSYAQVTKQKRYNTANDLELEEALGYLNDTTLWMLGLPTSVTNVGTGEVESQNVYDASKDTLSQRWRFGQQLMSYTFDSAGNLASFTDGNNHSTTLGSYKRGVPQSIGYPDTTSESLVVDDFGQISSLTDQAGKTTGYAYDGVGRLTRITYPTGDAVAWAPKMFAYDYVNAAERGIGANHWRRTVTQGGAQSVTYFDAELRPILSDSYDGSDHISSRIDYDWQGRKIFESYPKAGALSLSELDSGAITNYDALGRFIKTLQASELGTLTTTTAYLSGARVQVTNAEGKVTTTTYQVLGQPSYDTVAQVQAPAGVNQSITRDIYGNPQKIRQYGSYNGLTSDVTKYLYYDNHYRLICTSEPESGSTVMDYDDANNVAWTADGQSTCTQSEVAESAKTKRQYDQMNRVTSLTTPSDTQDTNFHYDALGNVDSAVSGISTWSSHRNGLGLLKDETLQLIGQSAWTLKYEYDPNGHLMLMTYPDGTALSYAPDALGRPTQVGGFATDVRYYASGDVASLAYGNGAVYSAHQNDRLLLSDFTYAKDINQPDISEAYTYDENANITAVADWADMAGGTRSKAFTYDDLNRLTGASASALWGSEGYAYDPLNNIRSRTNNGVPLIYTYDGSNRLTAITGGTTFAYDTRGNVINKSGVPLTFDAKNQLLDVNGQVTYAYDASGRRVSKAPLGGKPTYYFYSQAGQLMYQVDTAAAKTTVFAYLGRKLLSKISRNVGETAPQIPATISFNTNPNNGDYAVSWSAANDPGYQLQESINGGGWTTVYSGSALSRSYAGRSGGTYSYRVRTCDGDCSDWRTSVDLGVWPALANVAVPSGTQGPSYVVTWSRPISTTTLDVEEQKDGGAWQRIASDTVATSISRSSMADGTYLYRVSAKNAYGTRGWAISSPVTVLNAPTVAPSASVPAISSTGSYTVSWTGVTGASSYTLEQQKDGGAWIQVYSGSATSKAFSGAVNGSHYNYRVQAGNGTGLGPWSGTATVEIAIPPPPPTSVYANDTVVNPKMETLTVVWTASSGASSYDVENADTGVAVLNNTTTTSVVVESGSPIAYNSYAVRACNPYACSAWVTATMRQVQLAPTSAPTVTVPSNSTGSYTVSWASVFQAGTYTLQESANGGGWSTAYSGGSRSMGYSKSEGSYAYRVQACNTGGCGPWSVTASVVVATPPPAPEGVYANDTVVNPKVETLTVVWDASSGATSYDVKNTNTNIVVYSGASLSVQVESGVPLALNDYAVRACKPNACSAWVAASLRQVQLAPTSAPSLSIPSGSTGTYTVSWGSVYQAGSYTLQESANGGGWVMAYSGASQSKAYSRAAGTYGYRVQACNSGGCGPWSSTGSVNVLPSPATPSGLSATLYIDHIPMTRPPVRYFLAGAWAAVPNAASYELNYCDSSGSCITTSSTTNSPNSFRVLGVITSASVRACNAAGCSAWSAAVTPTRVDEYE